MLLLQAPCGPDQWPSGIYLAGRAGSGARRPVFCTLLDAGGQLLILCGQELHPRAPQKCPFSGPVWLLSHCRQTGLMRSSDTTWQLLGPVGTRMGGGKTKTKHAFLFLCQLPTSHSFTLNSGYDLVSREKGCQTGLKPCQQTYRGQGFGQPVGEGALSLRTGVGTRWDWEIPGDLTGTSSEQVDV